VCSTVLHIVLGVLINLTEECLIDFRELLGAHSGENMADAVWETVEKFGLCGRVRIYCLQGSFTHRHFQIIAFVMDNATNNDTLVEAFAAKCHMDRIPFESCHARMRCMPHTIHLAALKVLFFASTELSI
jgi:hypothetical protein